MQLFLSLLLNKDFPILAQNIGLAGLTILIPIAIAIFTTKDHEFDSLDNNVVIDHVIRAKWLLVSVSSIFIPVLFWHHSSLCWRVSEILVWLFGVAILIRILILCYFWIKGNKFTLRFDYLKNLTNPKDMEESWSSVWDSDKVNQVNEEDFFGIFREKIDQLLKRVGDFKIILKLLGDFQKYLKKRSLTFLTYNALPKILDWHIWAWQKSTELLAQDDRQLEAWALSSRLERLLTTIFSDITSLVLTEDSMDAQDFFSCLAKHVKANEDKIVVVKGSKRLYVQNLLADFYRVFFEKVATSPNLYNIWQFYFPFDWKITSATLKDNLVQRITLDEFFQWAQGKIASGSKFDLALDEVAEGVFPGTDPIMWAAILTFIFSPFDPANRIKYVIERPWIFGFSTRMKSFTGFAENDEEFQKSFTEWRNQSDLAEQEETIKLTVVISKMSQFFGHVVNETNLNQYIKQAEGLPCKTGTDEYLKKDKLIRAFNLLLEEIKVVK